MIDCSSTNSNVDREDISEIAVREDEIMELLDSDVAGGYFMVHTGVTNIGFYTP